MKTCKLQRIIATTPRITPNDVLETAKDIDPVALEDGWNARRVSVVLRRYGLRTSRSHGKRLYRMNASDKEVLEAAALKLTGTMPEGASPPAEKSEADAE